MNTVCIVGAGFMGAQIGLNCASYGYIVWIVDPSGEAREKALQSHIQALDARVQEQQISSQEKQDILSRIHLTENLKEGASVADLVIEAIPERLDLKREVFRQLDHFCPSHSILATNSSSIRISQIEDATERLDKVINTHFFRPRQNSIVELMRGTKTSDETVESVRQFAVTVGVIPLLVQKESTGFIFNRVWRAIKKETLHLVDEGVASHEDVDRAWMILMGNTVGPFGMMDMVGLDVVRDIEMVYYHESGDESDVPPKLLLNKIEKGELGVKSGKGFYTYPNPVFQNPSWLHPDKD